MVALLLYAYARGERSSRQIERGLHEDVTYPRLSSKSDPLVRIAVALERIAAAPEVQVRQGITLGPEPALIVKRPHGDSSGLGSANLHQPRVCCSSSKRRRGRNDYSQPDPEVGHGELSGADRRR